MLELRAKVKAWERQFEAQHHRKPSSADIKSDKEVLRMYQQYKAARSSSHRPSSRQPQTPQKPQNQESDTEPDEPTPLFRKVNEVFPTPSLRGKVLGLFDVDLSSLPETPQKPGAVGVDDDTASPMSKVQTPSNSITMAETPQSKRTPDYFLQRVNLFPTSGAQPAKLFPTEADPQESPLVKRKVSRAKSVSDLVREASLFQAESASSEGAREESDNAVESVPTDDNDKKPETGEINTLEGEYQGQLESAPAAFDTRGRRRPKRQTKRVIMRPIDESQAVSYAKPTENYRRLKINNTNFKKRR